MSTTTLTTLRDALHAHICVLQAVCDGAYARDGAGFSKFDRATGYRLADTDPNDWTDQDERTAARLTTKYARQLALSNTDMPMMRHAATRGDGVSLTVKDGRFALSFPYDLQTQRGASGQQLGVVVRALPRRSFNTFTKTWEGPVAENAVALRALCEEFGVVVSETIEAALSTPPLPAASAAPAPQATLERNITLQGEAIVIAFPYNEILVAAVRALKDQLRAGQWDAASKSWQFPLNTLCALAVVKFAEKYAFDAAPVHAWHAARVAEHNAAQEAADRIAAERVARLGDLSAPLPSGRTLFPFQRAGVEWLVQHPKAILADGMGCGKTTEALLAAKAWAHDHTILVVCPASLKDNWLREAETCGVSISVHSWAKIPEPLEATPYVVIADEAHYSQNIASQRTKRFLELAHGAQAVWCLSGTPIKNGRPSNLWPLLVAVGHPLARDKKAYELRYCAAHATRFTRWDITGAAFLDELHGHLKSHMLRRTKAEVLQDLPAKTRVKVEVEPSADELKAYKARLAELRHEYARRVHEGEIRGEGQALVFLGHLRQCGSAAKITAAVTLAEDILEEGGSVVLFTESLDTVMALRVALMSYGVSVITGDVVAEHRQAAVDRFQSGQNRVFVGTTAAGGVGLTLTAAHHVILVDRPWTSGEVEQAEDRCHRIGQHNAVTAHWLQLPKSLGLDVWIDQLIEKKQERIDLVLAGKRKSLKGVESVSSAAGELLEGFLG